MSDITTDFRISEMVIKESVSERVVDLVSHVGRLWLTNQRLIFKSRALPDPYEFSFALGDIKAVEQKQVLNSPGIVIRLRDDRTETFRLSGAQDWIDSINMMRGAAPPPAAAASARRPPPRRDNLALISLAVVIGLGLLCLVGVACVAIAYIATQGL